MAQNTREFFESLESSIDPVRAAGLSSAYLFEVEGAGTWLVDARGDGVTVQEGGSGADCVIATSQDTFERIVARELNPTTAYMTGKLKVRGDMGAALKLQNLF
jgi:putative sterol carrier protein